jgi:putrescine importer
MSSPAVESKPAPPPAQQALRRTLTLWQLILYGVIVIQPTAPMPNFGVLYVRGNGHVVTTILIAMVAMLLTAFSYGKMARAYPSAGSAFTYVGQEIHPSLGYVTGWSMAMDYMLNPLICILWCSKAAHELAPGVPYAGIVFPLFFFALFTGLNLRGIKTSARLNTGLAIGMGVVIAMFFIAALRFLFGGAHEPVSLTQPFYDPATFNSSAVLGGTSLAVLTYIGFDGISTLSEEAENPRRNILLATVFSCLAIGVLSAVTVYLAQLVWPARQPFADPDTAFIAVCLRAAGPWFKVVVNVTLLVATIGSGMGAQLGAARLLFGMGRSNALPSFFAAVDPVHKVPRNSVIFVGVIALVGGFGLTVFLGADNAYGTGAELLNFGALIAFMGVNMAAFLRYFVRAPEKSVGNLVAPLVGFVICGILWWNLKTEAKIVGAIWMVLGVAFGAVKTRGFRGNLVNFDIPADES